MPQHRSTLPPAATRLLATTAAWLDRTPPIDAPPPAAPRLDTTPVDDLLVDDAHADDGPLPPRSLRLHRARLRALWLAQGIAADCAK
jgi:hypothetical protein